MNTAKSSSLRKLLVVVAVVAAASMAYLQFGATLSLKNLAHQETHLRAYQLAHPVLVFGIAFVVYVSVTGLSLPGAAVLTLVAGWYFGFLRGLILVSLASTSGATIAFLLSRYLLRDTIKSRFGDRLAAFDRNLESDGAIYLFTLRLIPAIPFFVINVVMGLTPMKTRTFWWVSQVGMLAGTAVFVYAGSTFPTLAALAKQGPVGIITAPTVIAFVCLGLFPLAAKRVMAVIKQRRTAKPAPAKNATA